MAIAALLRAVTKKGAKATTKESIPKVAIKEQPVGKLTPYTPKDSN